MCVKQKHAQRGAHGAIIIELPQQLKTLEAPLVQMVDLVLGLTAGELAGHRSTDYAAVEKRVAEALAETERAMHRVLLSELDIDAATVVLRGKPYRRVGRGPGDYHTRAGTISVERSLYRESGSRGGKAIDAISLRAGCYGKGWLPHTAEAIGHMVQLGPCRKAVRTASIIGVLPYSAATLDRVAHKLGECWMRQHADIEGEMMSDFELPEGAASISMSLDRAAMPMEEPLKRPRGRPRKGAAKNPIARNFRMAYCGTVAIHDRNGEAIHTLRYGCMPKGEISTVVAGMVDDVRDILAKAKGNLKVTNLADGAPEMWGLLQVAQEGQIHVDRETVDYYHFIEKLSPAAHVIYGANAMGKLRKWRRSLLGKRGYATKIRRELIRSGKRDVAVGDSKPVHEAITYLTNHAGRFEYADARREGLPIGSGGVEASCKSIVLGRMKLSGARWKNDTGEHVIRLRALAVSDGDRWGRAMPRLHASRRAAVRPAMLCAV